jgi:Tfp pilus assembly ATPase PilU
LDHEELGADIVDQKIFKIHRKAEISEQEIEKSSVSFLSKNSSIENVPSPLLD